MLFHQQGHRQVAVYLQKSQAMFPEAIGSSADVRLNQHMSYSTQYLDHTGYICQQSHGQMHFGPVSRDPCLRTISSIPLGGPKCTGV